MGKPLSHQDISLNWPMVTFSHMNHYSNQLFCHIARVQDWNYFTFYKSSVSKDVLFAQVMIVVNQNHVLLKVLCSVNNISIYSIIKLPTDMIVFSQLV